MTKREAERQTHHDANHVAVWYDKTSDPSDPAWVVSLCDAEGGEIRAIAYFADRDEAVERGTRYATGRDLPLRVEAE